MWNDLDIKKWLLHAYHVAARSPHLTTQKGAVIVSEKGIVLGEGSNDFPRGVERQKERLQPGKKSEYVEHAERAAIFQSLYDGKAIRGATMFCPWFACAECARAIVATGITTVIGHKESMDKTAERWKETIRAGDVMLKEAGVKTLFYSGGLNSGLTLRFDGKTWTP